MFIKEYIDLCHITEIHPHDNDHISFYLTHHCVIKESSLTTKLRVVFNGSAKFSTNLSLNDVFKVGPTDELFNILIRFRKQYSFNR